MRILAPIVILLSLSGCAAETGKTDDEGTGPVESDPCEPGDSPTVVLGYGELEYLDLDPDTPTLVELIHGPQGGYHVNMAIAATQLDASTPWAVDLTGDIDGEQVGETRPLATLRCNPGAGALQAWALLLIWDAQPDELHGRIADVTGTVLDSAGTELTATATIEIWDPSLE